MRLHAEGRDRVIAPGAVVIWRRESRGGYGYITLIRAVVIRVRQEPVLSSIRVVRIVRGAGVVRFIPEVRRVRLSNLFPLVGARR